MNNRLSGKIAVITGGSCGIGKSIAQLFYTQGAKVLTVDVLDRHNADNYCIEHLTLDVSLEDSWQEICSYIKNKYKKLNILINNAGISGVDYVQDPESMSMNDWNKLHSINLNSVFLGCKFAINIMKNNKENCSIVNISSRSGIVAVPNLAAYSSTKAAIRNYTQSVALYCAHKGYKIRCNTISPAAIDTSMWNHLKIDNKKFNSFVTSLPLKRMGDTKEVAYAALYLSSDESLYTTGSEIIIDGGILANGGSVPK